MALFMNIHVGGVTFHLILQKVLQALYPEQTIHWMEKPHFEEIETYILFYSSPYGEEESSVFRQAIQYAQEMIDHQRLKPEAHILIIFFHDIKVAFPERKLQREKWMSEMMTEDILQHEAIHYQERIRITHEFGTSNLQDSLQQLTGTHLYFEIMD